MPNHFPPVSGGLNIETIAWLLGRAGQSIDRREIAKTARNVLHAPRYCRNSDGFAGQLHSFFNAFFSVAFQAGEVKCRIQVIDVEKE